MSDYYYIEDKEGFFGYTPVLGDDFDIEIAMDVHKLEKDFRTFIFFSGDGDFAPLMKYLIEKKKQVIVVYASGHIGREIWQIQKGIFKVNVENIGL